MASSLTLYPYQEVGADFVGNFERVILADDMGVGKTGQIISAVKRRRKRILVVCNATVRGVWEREIPKWGGDPDKVVVLRDPKDASLITNDTQWLVVNHENMRVHLEDANGRKVEKKGGKDKVKALITPGVWEDPKKPVKQVASTALGEAIFRYLPDTFICDEYHLYLLNEKSASYRGAKILAAYAGWVVLTTGTPLMRGVQNFWPALHLLYPKKWSSKWKFLQKYANARPGAHGWVWDKECSKPKELARELSDLYLRREKGDVLKDLPQRTVQEVYLDPTPEQVRLAEQFEKELIVDLGDDMVVNASTITKIIRLRQLSIDPRLIRPSLGCGGKIAYAADYIESTDQKVVVFSNFKEAINLLVAELGKRGVPYCVLTGDTPANRRDFEVEAFQTRDDVRAFLATIQAGGPGITLTAGSVALFLDRDYTPGINEQAEARIDRIGQTKPITIVKLKTTGSVDDFVYDIEEAKTNAISGINSAIRAYVDRNKDAKWS